MEPVQLKMIQEHPCCGSPKDAPSSNTMTTAGYILLGVPVLASWWVIYKSLEPFAGWLADHFVQLLSSHFSALGNSGHLRNALEFLFYDTPKVLMLLVLVVFGVGIIRSFFTPERTRKILAGKRESVGNVLAAMLGIVTPFCSCSAVPLFIGFLTASVPLGSPFHFSFPPRWSMRLHWCCSMGFSAGKSLPFI